MLRYLVAFLLILNLLFFGWMQGWFISVPLQEGRSPDRLQRQVSPAAIRVLAQGETLATPPTEQATTSTDSGPEEPIITLETPKFFCLESGPLNGEQLTQLQEIVQRILPPEAIERDSFNVPNSWVVYLGLFPDENTASRRRQELRAQGIDADIVRGKPEFQPGITLGLFSVETNAEKHLAQMNARGIRDARIVVWSAPPKGQLLRIKEISERQWDELYLLTRGNNFPSFTPCENTP